MQKVSLRTRVLRSAESKGVIEGGIEKKKEKKVVSQADINQGLHAKGNQRTRGMEKGQSKNEDERTQ